MRNEPTDAPLAPVRRAPAPPGRFLEKLADRLDADERRGLEAEGDREGEPRDWGAWADNFTHVPSGPDVE